MKTQRTTRLILFPALLALAALACNLAGASVPEATVVPTEAAPTDAPVTETAAPAETVVAEITPTGASAEPLPSGTPDEAPAGGLAACVPAGDADLPAAAPPFADLPTELTAYLSAGGSIDGLTAALEDWGAIATDDGGETYGLARGDVDLTGDAVADVVVIAVDSGADMLLPFAPPGDLLVYTCADGAYQLGYQASAVSLDDQAVPELLSLGDVTGDGVGDLLYTRSNCGAHTCFETVYGARWDDASGAFVSIVDTISEPSAEVAMHDEDGDGLDEIVVDVGMIGSVGAGVQRTFRDVYAYDGSVFERALREVTSQQHPIHAINDADDLFDAGDYAAALALYERAITDPELDRSIDLYTGWQGDIEGWARYRTVLAAVQMGSDESAAAANDALQAAYPDPAAPGGTFAEYADTFWAAYTATGSASQGCDAVNALLPDDLTFSGEFPLNQYGYANRAYRPADVCPF